MSIIFPFFVVVMSLSIRGANKDLKKYVLEEEKLDGYYMIVSSELDARPVYVSRKEHIETHFLTCYIALVLSRVLQHKLDKKYHINLRQISF